MIYTQGAVAQMDDTVKHREHSHSGTVTVEKQQTTTTLEGPAFYLASLL